MRVAIELVNSSMCSLDSRIVEVAEGGDLERQIAIVLRQCIDEWVISPGDIIKVTELL